MGSRTQIQLLHLWLQNQEAPRMEALAKENGQNLQNAKKPRLKWSAELHDQFLKAVYQLGGAHGKYKIK